MQDGAEELLLKVEQWDDTGTKVENVLALARDHFIALKAFEAAIQCYPSCILTVRRGNVVLHKFGCP